MLLLMIALIFAGTSCLTDDSGGSSGDNGGMVWLDSSTGLVWQVMPDSGYVNWMEAVQYCDDLVLDAKQDWRLPSISELRSLISGCSGTETDGACEVTDSCRSGSCQTDFCYSCEFGDGPSNGCYGVAELSDGCDHYWSGTTVTESNDRAWAIGFASGFIYKPRVSYAFHARCVR